MSEALPLLGNRKRFCANRLKGDGGEDDVRVESVELHLIRVETVRARRVS